MGGAILLRIIQRISFVVLICLGSSQANAAISSCEYDFHYRANDYLIRNNLWGVGRSNYDNSNAGLVCLRIGEFEDYLYKINWGFFDTESRKTNRVLAYPRISWGWDWTKGYYWGWDKTRNARNIGCLNSKIMARGVFSGKLNVSYDLWVSRKPNPTLNDITAEIMIWVYQLSSVPAGKYQGSVNIGDRKFSLYIGNVSSGKWKYIALVGEDSVRNTESNIQSNYFSIDENIDLGKIISYLNAKGYISDDSIVNGVSFGPEIYGGFGSMVIDRFEVMQCNE